MKQVVVPVGGRPFSRERSASAGHPPALAGRSRLNDVVNRTVESEAARAEAHAAFLRYSANLQRTAAVTIALQTALLETVVAQGDTAFHDDPAVLVLDRSQCLEFAVGSIGRVLGPDFAEIDSFPTRVRLPDEPLMLVDRIVAMEGGAAFADVRAVSSPNTTSVPARGISTPGASRRASPSRRGRRTFSLPAYLGIDLRTRGLAVYRLLDAVVTFHRGLPAAGAIIRYDIRIDRFFRQGETHLFRFQFDGHRQRPTAPDDDRRLRRLFHRGRNRGGQGRRPDRARQPARAGPQPDDEADLVPRRGRRFRCPPDSTPCARRPRRVLRGRIRGAGAGRSAHDPWRPDAARGPRYDTSTQRGPLRRAA